MALLDLQKSREYLLRFDSLGALLNPLQLVTSDVTMSQLPHHLLFVSFYVLESNSLHAEDRPTHGKQNRAGPPPFLVSNEQNLAWFQLLTNMKKKNQKAATSRLTVSLHPRDRGPVLINETIYSPSPREGTRF